jgi:DNA ligase-1
VQFSELAHYAGLLEATTSRTALVNILAELFSAAEQDEIAPITYLLQGRLAPFFAPLEMGLGNTLVSEAIARAYHTDRATVQERFNRIGDLGTVAGQLAAEHDVTAEPDSAPAVHAVFDRLRTIAQAAGPGSTELKTDLFTELLGTLDARSTTFVCRVPLGTLRLGVGDPTRSPKLAVRSCASGWSAPTTRLRISVSSVQRFGGKASRQSTRWASESGTLCGPL